MRRRSTGKDVAERAGVSLTTVSFVLNGRTDRAISDETRERVLGAARELGYRPNGLVRGLVRGRTQTVGVVVPRLDSSFHATIVQGIQEVCARRDHRILLADSRHELEYEQRQVDLLLEHRVDGIISVAMPDDAPAERTRSWVGRLAAEGVAFLVVDDHSFGDLVDCVVSDDLRGARLAAEHLIALGHRRIAHLSAGQAMSSSRDRRAGYLAALAAAGVAPDERLIAGGSYFLRAEELRRAAEALLALPDRPTALFAANDDLAAEAIAAARDLGLHVPGDLAVAGYGNTEVGRHLEITSIHQEPLEMGRRAALRLSTRLEERDLPPEIELLPVRLVVRASSGARNLAAAPPAGRAASDSA